MSFFYISAPYLLNSRQATIKEIRDSVIGRKLALDGGEMNLKKVNFKMANLDTLMFCNDKAIKLESLVESLLKKIDKQFCDLSDKASHEWWIKGEKEIPIKRYVADFSWNLSKYPAASPIPHVFSEFDKNLNIIESMLRSDTTRYNEAKAQLAQLAQKEGNYNVKDLSDVIVDGNVRAKDFHYTQFITTVVCVVPVVMLDQFSAEYWRLTDYVVPNSAKKLKIPEKDGLSLWSVDIFNQKMEDDRHQDRDYDEDEEHHEQKKHKKKRYANPVAEFIDVARDRFKIVVREFKFEPGMSEERKNKRSALTYALETQTNILKNTLKAQFSEAFELYVHVKVTRMITETRMRFGSDKTVYYWLEPIQGKEKLVQGTMVEIFGDKQSEGLYGTKDEIEDAEDFFPFIYVPGILL